MDELGRRLHEVLSGFEAVQQSILFDRIGEAQTELHDRVTAPLEAAQSALPECDLPDLTEAVQLLSAAYASFIRRDQDFSLSFLSHRRAYCQALALLYGRRADLPSLEPYWYLEDAYEQRDVLERAAPDNDAPVGLLSGERNEEHAEYALYVPEHYSPKAQWPLIVCLHGGYGRENEYIWTWMRPAKSRGYLLLSPKSADVTWSIVRPALDVGSILRMIEKVSETYAVDPGRIFLTGLSDGGTFSYLMGLLEAERFAGVAPVAAAFHPMMDPMLRQGRGKELPIFIVHGVHDAIFPVGSARTAHQLLTHLEYDVRYEELPDWGHAYTYDINERLLLPWFEKLAPR